MGFVTQAIFNEDMAANIVSARSEEIEENTAVGEAVHDVGKINMQLV